MLCVWVLIYFLFNLVRLKLSYNGLVTQIINAYSDISVIDATIEGIPGLTNITVYKPSSTSNSFIQFYVTFDSLKYVSVSPRLEVFSFYSLSGVDVQITTDIYRHGHSIPVYLVSIYNTSIDFDLFWDQTNLGRFTGKSSVDDILEALEQSKQFQYYEVESHVGVNTSLSANTRITQDQYWYLLLVPLQKKFENTADVVSYENLFGRLNIRHSSFENTSSIDVTLIKPFSEVNFGEIGEVSFTLDEIGCVKTTVSTWCNKHYLNAEFTPNIPIQSDTAAVKHDLEKGLTQLRSIKQVSVVETTIKLPFYDASNTFLLCGYKYAITFLKVTDNSTGSAVTDLSGLTWYPEIASFRYSGFTTEAHDLPLLQYVDTGLLNGWSVSVRQTQATRQYPFINNSMVVPIEVTINGVDYTSNGVTFAYDAIPTVLRVDPPFGVVTGNTAVTVFGYGFVQSSLLSCQFGDGQHMVVRASYYFNATTVLCNTPPSLYGRSVQVRVSNNGVFNSYESVPTASDLITIPGEPSVTESGSSQMQVAQVMYHYHARIKITQVIPPLGPVSGNFSVKVIGGPFNDTLRITCRFGTEIVSATYWSSGEIHCFPHAHSAGIYPLEISMNNQDYSTSRTPFFFYKDEALSRISPVSGPALSGGTEVHVYGAGFVNSTLLTCKFGHARSTGTFITSNHIICPSPALDPLVNGEMHYTAISEQYNRYKDPRWVNNICCLFCN